MKSLSGLKSGGAVCALVGAAVAFAAAPANADNYASLKVLKEAHHDTSLPLRDMIRIYNREHPNAGKHIRPHQINPVRPIPYAKSDNAPDGIVGETMSPRGVPTTDLLNFDGVDDADSLCGCAPPDTNGAVGATQYVQWVNTAFEVFDKSTGAVIQGPTAGNALWSGFAGRCQSNNDGDIIAQYDKAAGRWVMLQPVFSPPYKICVAVSTTSDATGSYNRYEFDKGSSEFPDYPKLGIWPAAGNEGYFYTVNSFGSGFDGAQLCAMDRTAMLAGNTATQQCFQLSSAFGSVLPGDFDGQTLPPAGEDEDFVNFSGSSTTNFWKMHADFANPANTTLSGPIAVVVPAFTRASDVPQKGTTQRLDALSDRMMYRLAYRNLGDHEAFVTDHSVNVNGRAAVRWYEFRKPSSPTLFQSGNIKNRRLQYWMGSIAMDKNGDIAAGYSTSSANDFPGISYAGREPADRKGRMKKHRGLTTRGGGSQTGGLDRWGDYSAMSVDPIDDCTFYYTQEYLKATGSFNWDTKVNSFKFNGCT